MTNIKIDESWKIELIDEFNSLYMSELRFFLKKQLQMNKKIFPPMHKIFNAFNSMTMLAYETCLVLKNYGKTKKKTNGL